MDAREVIRHFLRGTDLSCDDLITALEWHGNRIIHRDENHGPTLERAAQMADERRKAWLEAAKAREQATPALPTSFQTERAGEDDFIAAAIRSMGEKK